MATKALRQTITEVVNTREAAGFAMPGTIPANDDTSTRSDLGRVIRAAETSFAPIEAIRDLTRRSLSAANRRYLERGGWKRDHPGISIGKVRRLSPLLVAELDRHQSNTLALIEANRVKALADIASRFIGWSSSSSPGGIKGNREAIKRLITKPIKTAALRERNILRDQNAKLRSSLSDVIAQNSGAIAAMWHSRWHDPGYDYREDHKEFDELVFAIRNSWAHQQGFIAADVGYTDEQEMPAELWNCKCHYKYIYALEDLPSEMRS